MVNLEAQQLASLFFSTFKNQKGSRYCIHIWRLSLHLYPVLSIRSSVQLSGTIASTCVRLSVPIQIRAIRWRTINNRCRYLQPINR